VWQGRTNPEIAWVVGTSEQVIKNHLRNVFELGVWSRLELALYVASHGGNRWAEPTAAESAPNTLTGGGACRGCAEARPPAIPHEPVCGKCPFPKHKTG
jgi:hypothetical protein